MRTAKDMEPCMVQARLPDGRLMACEHPSPRWMVENMVAVKRREAAHPECTSIWKGCTEIEVVPFRKL